MKIVFASSNKGKITELQALLENTAFTVIPQADLGVGSIEETASTFVENALIKARHAAKVTGLPAIADDSGLAVAALGGAPGIYSARYAGDNAKSSDNIAKLLEVMKDIPEQERGACFVCVLVYLAHAADPTPLICQGVWRGKIAIACVGTQGFGYDPIFYVPLENMTAAQLPLAIKNRFSHRGQALKLLVEGLCKR